MENIENVAHPICPINMYFEGDEDKCNVAKCDFENRHCSEACKVKNGDWWYDEDLLEKIIHNQTCEEMGFSLSKYKHLSIHNAEGLFVAYCGCHDKTLSHVLRILKCVNGWDTLVARCFDLGIERDVALGELSQVRPYADCYEKICEVLGIKNDILGYIKNLMEQQKALKTICTFLISQAECMLQSHQCADHPDGNCCDRTGMRSIIKETEKILTDLESKNKNDD